MIFASHTPNHPVKWLLVILTSLFFSQNISAASFDAFVGKYTGSATQLVEGEMKLRDMNVSISPTKKGFQVIWASTAKKNDGRLKKRQYTINFVESERPDIFASAMRVNIFGGTEALDPMQGDPFVWARIHDNVLTIYALIILENGSYEMQTYDRKLVDEGLELIFRRHRDGVELKKIHALLKRMS